MGVDQEALTPEQQERLGQAVRFGVRRLLTATLLLVVTIGITAFVLSWTHPERHPNMWVLWALALGVPLLALVAGTAVGARMLRRPGPTRRLLLSGDRGDIRRVSRDLHKGRVVSPEDREIAASLVGTMRTYSRLAWAWLALGLAWIILALVEHDRQGTGGLVNGLLFLLLGGAFWWSTRRTLRHAAIQGIDASIGVRRRRRMTSDPP